MYQIRDHIEYFLAGSVLLQWDQLAVTVRPPKFNKSSRVIRRTRKQVEIGERGKNSYLGENRAYRLIVLYR